jgi:SAM-dependent methyltransferase
VRSEGATPDFLSLHLRELPYFRSMLRAVEARWMQQVELPSPVLDLGCGDGHFAAVALLGRQADIGLDLDRPSLREAGRRGVYRMRLQSSGGALPLRTGTLGSAFSNSVLEHMHGLQDVLNEVGRVLRPGAPFVFTVPNPGYRTQLSFPAWLRRAGLRGLAQRYEDYFMWMSRTRNLYFEDGWATRLEAAGMSIEHSFHYFSPSALHTLEWGHYFGAPCLLPRWLTGRWILVPARWNLRLTDRFVRRYYDELPASNGTYTFYLARRR